MSTITAPAILPPTRVVAVPAQDLSIDGWRTSGGGSTNLYQELAGGTFIKSAASPANDTYEVKLAQPAAGLSSNFWVRYSFRKQGSQATRVRVVLLEGKIVKQAWDHTDIAGTLVEATQLVTATITDWSDVRLKFIANAGSSKFARPLLIATDFQYVGSFNVPLYNNNPFSTGGLSHRYESSVLRLLGTTGYSVYEFTVPTPSLDANPANWPTATVLQDYGSIASPLMNQMDNPEFRGVYYDPVTDWLLLGGRDNYNALGTNYQSYMAYNRGTAQSIGPWNNTGDLQHAALGGASLRIPQWFSDAYLNGDPWFLGNGFRASGQGAFHYGPVFASGKIEGSNLVNNALVRFPQANPELRDPTYTYVEDDDPTNDWLTPSPPDGMTAGEFCRSAVVWVDLPDKHGIILIPCISRGEIVYRNARIEVGGIDQYWYVYDPEDVAASAQGQIAVHEAHAKSYWKFVGRGGSVTYAPGSTNPVPDDRALGATLDDRRLYVLMENGGKVDGINTLLGVHVFDIL